MSLSFEGPSLKAESKNTKSLVVLLHGYGASGDDLIALGNQWAKALPDTDFIAPHAPYLCEQNPEGRQWCSLVDWNPQRIGFELSNLSDPLNRHIDEELEKRKLGPENLALVGFSLGTFMAFEAGLHRPSPAGIVGYSGGYIPDSSRLLVSRPPVLLVHGEADPVLTHESTMMAAAQLQTEGVPVESHILPEIEHHIDAQGLGMGAGFLKQHLSEDEQEIRAAKA